MHKLKGNSIRLTRGDSFVAKINITRNGEAFTPGANDEIRFALKHNTMKPDRTDYKDPEPLITKVIPNDTLLLNIVPTDTNHLGFGDYIYDIQITFEDGSVDTFIAEAGFVITPEVDSMVVPPSGSSGEG